MTNIANHHAINGKTHHFYGDPFSIANCQSLPEGRLINFADFLMKLMNTCMYGDFSATFDDRMKILRFEKSPLWSLPFYPVQTYPIKHGYSQHSRHKREQQNSAKGFSWSKSSILKNHRKVNKLVLWSEIVHSKKPTEKWTYGPQMSSIFRGTR